MKIYNTSINTDLKKGHRYLFNKLRVDELTMERGLMCIKCLEVSATSYKIEYENGETCWISKELDNQILEDLEYDTRQQ